MLGLSFGSLLLSVELSSFGRYLLLALLGLTLIDMSMSDSESSHRTRDQMDQHENDFLASSNNPVVCQHQWFMLVHKLGFKSIYNLLAC